MRHHILLPTDFSENAWSAALYAIRMYAKVPCTFYFSHAWTFVNTGSRTYISPSYIDTLQNTSKEQLETLKQRAQFVSPHSEHEFKTIFSEDFLSESIKTAIKDHAIDLVVMGTKGATGAKEFLLGSNSVNVIKKVKLCPILLVPHKYEYAKTDRIAFATDFKRPYGDEILPLISLAKLQKSNLEILHINGPDDLTEKQQVNLNTLTQLLKDQPHNVHWIPEIGTKEEIISAFIEENNINLITMINYEHSFLEYVLNEPIIKKMGYHSLIPFMVIPHQS
ncbi:universal stress protein [Gelidibacter japonicus]|jgi:nucleotide-binding universal stress UspA family protein|uniref:universal stress protein n=1 Tax=Gelidibacter japonicus TaxID=1962232 RepID=UPI0013D12BE2|nr:universal stress protein [Gelidibacter japonicus]MCL8007578.1 universal stress protein [Gelidibacter japonicus]